MLPNKLISGPGNNGSFDVLCFSPPSAVHAWLENVGRVAAETNTFSDIDDDGGFSKGNGNGIAACIGETKAKACLESGRWNKNDVYYPETNLGFNGWADSTAICLGDILKRQFWEYTYSLKVLQFWAECMKKKQFFSICYFR